MKIIYDIPYSGKTLSLIKIADNYNGYIICRSREEAERVFNMALNLHYRINFPLTYSEFINKKYFGKGIKCFHIDDVDYFIQWLAFDVKIATITLTKENE